MSFRKYIRDHLLQLLLMGAGLGLLAYILQLCRLSLPLILLLCLVLLLCFLGGLCLDWRRRRVFYRNASATLEQLDRKSLLSEMLDSPGFAEGDFFCECLRQCNKDMNDQIGAYKREVSDYRDYIEIWVHEVKTPIASAKLLCDNNRKLELARSFQQELDRVNNLVEQALYYARSFGVQKDYIVRPCSLKSIVEAAVRQHARSLITAGFSVREEALGHTVYTDPKWMGFILGQLINNSVQYKRAERPQLRFKGEKLEEAVLLSVSDNGIGIPAQDLRRVFEKGFTGENGRRTSKSTGIGLYLCKKLCGKLGLALQLLSKEGEGTTLYIRFPLGSATEVVREEAPQAEP